VIPVAPDKTKWIRHILMLPEARDLPNFAELIADLRTRGLAVDPKDIGVNRLQQLSAASSFAQAGRLCHLEKPVWQLADYIRDRHPGMTGIGSRSSAPSMPRQSSPKAS
jgi:hypothetical protein